MKIPKTFLPEKELENKINQLVEEPKTYKKDDKTNVNSTELEELLKEFNSPWVDYDSVYTKAFQLLSKTGYAQINDKKFKCEYWTKLVSPDESYLFTVYGKKYEQHYIFSRIKNDKVEKFCKKFERRRKMVYLKSFLLTGLAISGFLSTSYLFSYYPQGNFLRDLLSWMAPSMLVIPTILSIPRVIKYIRGRTTKGLEKYCIGMITGDDKKALTAAFT